MTKALAGSFSNLESFSFVGESWQCGNGIQSVNTLEHVVSRCPRLKTLSLTRYWGVNSDLMEWLLRDAVELESLTLEEVYIREGRVVMVRPREGIEEACQVGVGGV
ncbi:hypothetical protein BC936DRAFT_143913 [Jimgerdemannia flammicorona]|nr:hypothetical protein BC936DRAFT_143913 [Jimgerdemannia flammicorona]